MDERDLLIEMRDKLNDVAQDVALCRKLLTGNGNPDRGLILRVDRVEGQCGRCRGILRRVVWPLVIAFFGAAGAWLWAVVVRK